MRLVNKLRYCLVATIPAVALAACSSGGSGVQTGPPPEQTSITIDAVPTADAAGLYIAADRGYFAQQGFTKVTIVPIHGGEYGMGDLQKGTAQLIEGNYVSFILAQAAGKFAAPNPNNPNQFEKTLPINMRLIADTSHMQAGNQALYVLSNSPYKTVQDLVNHHVSVGVNSLNNIGSVLLGSLLAANGYKLEKLKQVPEPLPLMPQLLSQHKISAAWLPEPFGTQAQQQYGAVQIADFNQGSLQNFPIGTIAGSADWVKSHPNTVAAFLRAFNEGQQVADTDRAAVEAALVKNVPQLTKQTAATMTLDTYPLAMDVPVMQRVADAMVEFGVLKKQYNIADMIQPEQNMITK
jgi:NitT/TauT family transport system substrate-binding protein